MQQRTIRAMGYLISLVFLQSTQAQNVGIGTNTPLEKLAVKTSNNSYGISHEGDGGLKIASFVGGIAGAFGTSSNHLFRLNANNAPVMSLLPNGNVGVGTDNALEKFSIKTLNNSYGMSHEGEGGLKLASFVGGISASFGTVSNHLFRLNANNAPVMSLLPNGNVGIGTDLALGKLHINSGGDALHLSGANSFISFYDAGGLYKGYLWQKDANDMELSTSALNTSGHLYISRQGIPAVVIRNDGYVGINGFPFTTNFHSRFKVNGAITIAHPADPAVEWTMEAYTTTFNIYKGNISIAYLDLDDGDWATSSDARLKENITPYKSVLDGIKNLTVSTFRYKRNEAKSICLGLIAQNVAEYFPELVSESNGKNGETFLGVAYSKTGVIALKGIQEQQAIIEKQQKEIDELKTRLEKLERSMAK